MTSDGRQGGWWHGTRGEWYVAAQLAFIVLLFFGPRTLPGLPAWPPLLSRFCVPVGIILMLSGTGFMLAAARQHGRRLTPLPYPQPDATLIDTGPYALIRHPMYAGGLLLAFGWALFVRGWLTLAYAVVMLVFLDVKSAREERWLTEKFPDYRAYQRRVRKLIPFVH